MNAQVHATQYAPHIVMVAGEASGDHLAAALIRALRERIPHARFSGIAGPHMIAAGCEAWVSAEQLAIMGLSEVIPHLPRLLRIRRELLERVIAHPPAVFIGVDAKEFNLSVARRLKAAGIRTVQYVSPQVWAWRQGRVKKISKAVDLMLCLLPFEKQFYIQHGVVAHFVGHPLADQIPLVVDQHQAQHALGLSTDRPCIAVLPGSRRAEVSNLADDFAATIAWLWQRHPTFQFVAPMANAGAREIFTAALKRVNMLQHVHVLEGAAQQAMSASDVVLLASGTATLEAALLQRPMVVAYRLSWLTTFLLQHLKLMKAAFFSQPNLLLGRKAVPEFFNQAVQAERLGPAVLAELTRPDRASLCAEFAALHTQLRCNASEQAAAAIVSLLHGNTV